MPPSRRKKPKRPPPPIFFAEPVTPSNSFVGTEEYIAPVSPVTLSQPSLSFLREKRLAVSAQQNLLNFMMIFSECFLCRKLLPDKVIAVP